MKLGILTEVAHASILCLTQSAVDTLRIYGWIYLVWKLVTYKKLPKHLGKIVLLPSPRAVSAQIPGSVEVSALITMTGPRLWSNLVCICSSEGFWLSPKIWVSQNSAGDTPKGAKGNLLSPGDRERGTEMIVKHLKPVASSLFGFCFATSKLSF